MNSAIRLASACLVRMETRPFTPVGGFVKRSFDIACALAALLILSPLFILIAILIKVTDPGPIFYGHTRVGHNGREFRCLKFRTMAVDGDALLSELLERDAAARAEWEATRKLRNDPRVSRVGAVLRKLSLDELPQLTNILYGDMSVVGPRPVVDDELALYGPEAFYYLHSRPGLTGLWQISGRNDVSYDSRVAFDRRYVETWSLVQDMWIIVKTVPAVCAQRGSY